MPLVRVRAGRGVGVGGGVCVGGGARSFYRVKWLRNIDKLWNTLPLQPPISFFSRACRGALGQSPRRADTSHKRVRI